mgnify:CR=1 FL=1
MPKLDLSKRLHSLLLYGKLSRLPVFYMVLLCSIALTQLSAQFHSSAWAKRERLPWTKAKTPSKGQAQSIGSYANGCLQGAASLPAQGPGFKSIRRFRHRYFAHPESINLVRKLGKAVQEKQLTPIEVGDLSQVRGGLMAYGHRSHQSGLDVDVWFGGDATYLQTEAKRRLQKLKRKAKKKKWSAKKLKQKRFDIEHPSLISGWRELIDQKVWSKRHQTLLRLAAEQEEVARIFVHFRIKEQMCTLYKASPEFKTQPEPLWLRKLRPWYGHHQHFHIRLHCPKDSLECDNQGPLPKGLGCEGLSWFSKVEQKERKLAEKDTEEQRKQEFAMFSKQEQAKIKAERAQKRKERIKAKAEKRALLLQRCAHLAPK